MPWCCEWNTYTQHIGVGTEGCVIMINASTSLKTQLNAGKTDVLAIAFSQMV